MLCRHAPGGAYMYVSPACRRIFGLEPSEMVGHHPLEFVHPDDVASVTAVIERARSTGGWRVEHRIVAPRRNVGWVQAASTSDPASGLSWVCVRDVTEEREREARLHALAPC